MIELNFNNYKIRPYKKEDAESLSKNANHPEISRYLSDGFPYPYTIENAEVWIKSLLEKDTNLFFAIVFEDEVIGGISATPYNNVHRFTAEVGFWLGKNYWNKGITTGALKTFCNYLFTKFNLNKITAKVFEGNEASKTVLLKCGFLLEGTHPESVFKNDIFVTHYSYGLLKKDFKYDR
ncbi:MAG: GNAT family protein [Ignavibacteriaceae bacterium]|jgi:RimJ/RimL family protein N-acetyltransferase|nr:GNAT family protein [Ignavibacteriaceae bacterium]